ncbi:hypothetical protein HanIR_Chr01g0035941 [Helianthus annuus]|nr:hypothetical protein HanIR_Chr01g0035941 [Helianthus annuus]
MAATIGGENRRLRLNYCGGVVCGDVSLCSAATAAPMMALIVGDGEKFRREIGCAF